MAFYKVKYTGLSDVRIMSEDDLKKHGIGVSADLVWEPYNRHTVFMENIGEALEEIFRAEGTFTVEEMSDESREKVGTIIEGKPLDDTGSMVRDTTTGQVSVNPDGKSANADHDPESSEPSATTAPTEAADAGATTGSGTKSKK